MDSFKILFKIIGLSLTGFLILTCTQDQTPTEPHIDYISPSVEWLYPRGGSELSGVVELRFSVYDEGGIDSACVYINGTLFGEGGHSPLNGEGGHSCPPLNGEGGHSCLPLNGEGGHSCPPVNNMGGRTFLPSFDSLTETRFASKSGHTALWGGWTLLSACK